MREFKGGPKKSCIYTKCIEYIEKWPFVVIFIYIIYTFVLDKARLLS